MNLLFFIIISKTFRRLNVFTDDDDILKGLSTTVSESDCTSELTSTTSFIGIGSPLIVIDECLSCEANSI
jgi:hypothetical protein